MWILLLLGQVFCICQIGQVVNCVLQMFYIFSDFSLCFLFYHLLRKMCQSHSLGMCIFLFFFSFNFFKFCFVYFHMLWIYMTLGLGKGRHHEFMELQYPIVSKMKLGSEFTFKFSIWVRVRGCWHCSWEMATEMIMEHSGARALIRVLQSLSIDHL